MTQTFRVGEELQGTVSGWNPTAGEGVIDVVDRGSVATRLTHLENARSLRPGDAVKFAIASDARCGVIAAAVRLMSRANLGNERKLAVGASGIGECTSWSAHHGYGFLRCASAADVFVHYTALTFGRELQVGDRVRFTVGADRHGRLLAQNVTLLERVPEKPIGSQWKPNLTTRNDSERTTR